MFQMRMKLGIVVYTLIPASMRQKQVDLCEIKASLVYRMSSRTAKAIEREKPRL